MTKEQENLIREELYGARRGLDAWRRDLAAGMVKAENGMPIEDIIKYCAIRIAAFEALLAECSKAKKLAEALVEIRAFGDRILDRARKEAATLGQRTLGCNAQEHEDLVGKTVKELYALVDKALG